MTHIRPNSKVIDASGLRVSLDWYQNNATLDDKGRKVLTYTSWLHFFESMVAEELLVSAIETEPELPEQTKRRTLNEAISRWLKFKKYRNNPNMLDAFKEAYSLEVSRALDNERAYQVLAFININPSEELAITDLDVLGGKVEVLEWSDLDALNLSQIEHYLSNEEHVEGLSKLVYEKKDEGFFLKQSLFTPLAISLKSFSVEDALSNAVDLLDLLRSCLNLSSASSSIIQYGHLTPVAKYMASPIYAAFSSDWHEYLDSVQTSPQYPYYSREQLLDEEIEVAIETLSLISEREDSFAKLIRRILGLYQQAIDHLDHRSSYLALWQVAEACVLDRPDHPTRVDKSLAKLTGLENQKLLDKGLSLVSDTRNLLVHQGRFPKESLNILFSLKKFVDIAISRLIALSNSIQDKYVLEQYLLYLSMNTTDLSRKLEALNLVLSERD